MQHQLRNVQQIQANRRAFAAILGDGSVVTWGDAISGGNIASPGSGVDQLKNVQQIQALPGACAAVLADGSAVAWGGLHGAYDSGNVQGSAKECEADPSQSLRFRCHSWRWVGRDLGFS